MSTLNYLMLARDFWLGKMKLNSVMMTICQSRKLVLAQTMSTVQVLVMTTLNLLPLLQLKLNNQVLSRATLNYWIKWIESYRKLSCNNPLLPYLTQFKEF